MKNRLGILCVLFLFASCHQKIQETALQSVSNEKEAFRICFGSCSHQKKDQPILNLVAAQKPDLFIYLGDNIYGDTKNMNELKAKYQKLAAKPEFQNLKTSTKIIATWDDHDYGENDAGKYYPYKKESKEIFLDFWEEPKASERYQHEGIYHSMLIEHLQKKIQIILLDTRTFRSDLTHISDKQTYKNDYQPTLSPDSTLLGAAQWKWLKAQFQKKAAVRIIASSNQFSHEYNGWESWNNVPHEQERMLQLIKETKANGIIFLSGDVHWGELSKKKNEYTYPLYDVTSSGLTQTWKNTEDNKNRVGEVIRETNYGLLDIHFDNNSYLDIKLMDNKDSIRVQQKVKLTDLQF